MRYVALGDSYTIGTSVDEAERFPNQLVERLPGTADLELVANLAVNGYWTWDVIRSQLPALPRLAPDFMTLLIGVNDVVRRVTLDRYRENCGHILDAMLALVPVNRIVVVSVPDYTLTPSGSDYGDPLQQRAAIAEVNATMRAETEQRGIAFVDISSVADRADEDTSLVATDGLHPSGAQYAQWVDLIAPVAARLLGGESVP